MAERIMVLTEAAREDICDMCQPEYCDMREGWRTCPVYLKKCEFDECTNDATFVVHADGLTFVMCGEHTFCR